MRMIDGDALMELYADRLTAVAARYSPDSSECGILSGAMKLLEIQPIIEERKTGKWVKVHGYCTPGGDPVWCCSECGKGVHVYGIEHGTYGADISDGQWKACPNCSALMEGEQS